MHEKTSVNGLRLVSSDYCRPARLTGRNISGVTAIDVNTFWIALQ